MRCCFSSPFAARYVGQINPIDLFVTLEVFRISCLDACPLFSMGGGFCVFRFGRSARSGRPPHCKLLRLFFCCQVQGSHPSLLGILGDLRLSLWVDLRSLFVTKQACAVSSVTYSGRQYVWVVGCCASSLSLFLLLCMRTFPKSNRLSVLSVSRD